MKDEYRLILNYITHGEFFINRRHSEKYEEYRKMAMFFLNHKGKYLFEDEILSEYNEGMTLERLFEQERDRFMQGANHERNGKREKTWYDVWSLEEVERNDDFFDYFFACKLRHIGLLAIDDFLSFHLGYSFDNDREKYARFLTLLLRTYKDSLINSNIEDTVKEWIELSRTEQKLSGVAQKEVKTKIKREKGDASTILNQEQTALLAYALRETKIILKDEYLNNTQAGQAFSILTGYSAEAFRQSLSIKELRGMGSKKNVEAVKEAIKKLQRFVENKLEPEG